MNAFAAKISQIDKKTKVRSQLKTLQVNMGNLCNQSCSHCHVGAGPNGKNIMNKKTIDDILHFLRKDPSLSLDITGGAPEMNPDFGYFVSSARKILNEIIVRTNLTILQDPDKQHLPRVFKQNQIRLVASLPCYTPENVDSQRGSGVFQKSLKVLKVLNVLGYGRDPGLVLDLVYNPGGAFLPVSQERLEKEYKDKLKKEYNADFNKLITITNAPIKRFKEHLEINNEYNSYMELLEDNFNESVVDNIMCRTLLSVGWDGKLYDCDFNQAMGMALEDTKGNDLEIGEVGPEYFTGREILFADHCFSCTAGSGSSCQGALKENASRSCCEEKRNANNVVKVREMVTEYYGDELGGSDDLKTSACCNAESIPEHVRKAAALVEDEIVKKFYGCGSPIPLEVKDISILDLGCGTGKDTYVISFLSGENARVIGLDMTENQLEIARKYVDVHMEKFDFKKTNVEFKKGFIEDLKGCGIEDNSLDIVVSNCVVNLSARKDLVFSEVYRVLKQGGEFYFSDVFCDRRLPGWMKEDPVLLGECLGGALYWKDFERLAAKAGFPDIRIYSSKPINITDPEIKEKVGDAVFTSVTYRMFKINTLEDACENYGQKAVYRGGIEYSENQFVLDDNHIFKKDEETAVCGNTAEILTKSRFSPYFKIIGDMSVHYGLFPGCGTDPIVRDGSDCSDNAPGSCCC